MRRGQELLAGRTGIRVELQAAGEWGRAIGHRGWAMVCWGDAGGTGELSGVEL